MKTESIDTLEKHLKLQESLHGPQSVEVARVLCRLAYVFLDRSQYGDAEKILRRAAQIMQNAPQRDTAAMEEIKGLLDRALSQKLQISSGDAIESLKVSNDRIPAFTPSFEPL